MEKIPEKAEGVMLSGLRGEKRDGFVFRRLNRPLSIRLSRYPITPNQISFISFLLSVLAAVLFVAGGYVTLLLGGVLAQFASIVDGCDGEISRLKFQQSAYRGWVDSVLDRYAEAFLLFGLTWHAYTTGTQHLAIFAGFLAILGSFMGSYTADKYDALMASKIKAKIRIGRDTRTALIFLGALLNQAFWVLVVIAAIMNAETIIRILVYRPINNLKRLKDEIKRITSRSKVPEDPVHAQNALEWLLKLEPGRMKHC
jgi:phosphatidylglycerophosphate synthase